MVLFSDSMTIVIGVIILLTFLIIGFKITRENEKNYKEKSFSEIKRDKI